MRCPYYPYFPVVLDILHSRAAEQVLDAPCGTGWLGDNLHATARRSVELDGVGLWEFPEAGGGYREVIEHDLETPLSLNRQYDAAVCCEAIHLVTNPGVLVESLRRALRPGGTVVITTPNTWYFRSRLQFLLRGFHSGFRPMVGRQRGQDYITYFPGAIRSCICCCRTTATWTSRCTRSTRSSPSGCWSICWRCRRACITGSGSSAPKARKRGSSGAKPRATSRHGRWLVVSARRPVEDMAA